MNIYYGIEADHLVHQLKDFQQFIMNETNIVEMVDNIFIYNSLEDVKYAIELFEAGELFTDMHELIKVVKGKKGELYFDYTIESETGNLYLYSESLIAFMISGGEEKQKELATLQYEEHLVFQWNNREGTYYFIEKQLKELISKIALAYDIEVSFFDLDK